MKIESKFRRAHLSDSCGFRFHQVSRTFSSLKSIAVHEIPPLSDGTFDENLCWFASGKRSKKRRKKCSSHKHVMRVSIKLNRIQFWILNLNHRCRERFHEIFMQRDCFFEDALCVLYLRSTQISALENSPENDEKFVMRHGVEMFSELFNERRLNLQ